MTEATVEFDENPQDPWLTDEEAAADLNWKWRSIVKGLMDHKPGYVVYAAVYAVDITTEAGKRVARANCSRLLANANFRKLWRRVLAEAGFNDQVVDTELFKLITGKDVEDGVKLKAIATYNVLRGRIVRNIKFDGEVKPNPYGSLTVEELRRLVAATTPNNDDNGADV